MWFHTESTEQYLSLKPNDHYFIKSIRFSWIMKISITYLSYERTHSIFTKKFKPKIYNKPTHMHTFLQINSKTPWFLSLINWLCNAHHTQIPHSNPLCSREKIESVDCEVEEKAEQRVGRYLRANNESRLTRFLIF